MAGGRWLTVNWYQISTYEKATTKSIKRHWLFIDGELEPAEAFK